MSCSLLNCFLPKDWWATALIWSHQSPWKTSRNLAASLSSFLLSTFFASICFIMAHLFTEYPNLKANEPFPNWWLSSLYSANVLTLDNNRSKLLTHKVWFKVETCPKDSFLTTMSSLPSSRILLLTFPAVCSSTSLLRYILSPNFRMSVSFLQVLETESTFMLMTTSLQKLFETLDGVGSKRMPFFEILHLFTFLTL